MNDLEEMSKTGKFDKEKYRVWFFGACTSLAYFDELRGGILPESVDRSNLDLLGTTPRDAEGRVGALERSRCSTGSSPRRRSSRSPPRWRSQATEAIEAVTDPSYTKDVKAELHGYMKNLIVHEGAGDNPVAASP